MSNLQNLLQLAEKENCPSVTQVRKLLADFPELNSLAENRAENYLKILKTSEIKDSQKLESEKRLKTEIAETDKVNSKQFSDGITVKSEMEFDSNRKNYPVSIYSTADPVATHYEESFVGKSSTLYRPYTQDIKLGKYTQVGAVLGENPPVPEQVVNNKPVDKRLSKKINIDRLKVSNFNNKTNTSQMIEEGVTEKISVFTKPDMGDFPGLAPNNDSYEFGRLSQLTSNLDAVAEDTAEALKLTESLFTNKVNPAVETAPQKQYSPGKIGEPSFQLTSPTEESVAKNTIPKETTNKVTIFTNPDQGSLDFTEKKTPVVKPAPVVVAPVVKNTQTAERQAIALAEQAKIEEAEALARASAERDRLLAEAADKREAEALARANIVRSRTEAEHARIEAETAAEKTRVNAESLAEQTRAKATEDQLLADNIAERDRLRAEAAAAKAAKPAVDPNAPKPPSLQTQTTNGGTPQPHANTPKRTFADLSKANLFSFDTETTGIDTKTAQIWQYGFAEKSTNSVDYIGSDYHVDPFENKKLTNEAFIKSIKEMNGSFSEKAYLKGNFSEIIAEKVSGALEANTHTQGLLKTLGQVNEGSILVMQNMNFENNLLREAFERGEFKQSVYTDLQSKMLTTSLDDRLQKTNELLQRPASVVNFMREADFTYHTEFSKYRTDDSFKKYTGLLNSAFDEYDSIIKTVTKTSKIPVIELMDISKTFLANLAENGLIEKETSTLGLNIDYLTRSFYGRQEAHTAMSDSKDTIQLFEDMYKHTKDMRNGLVTDELKALAKSIKDNQPDEVNRRFVASITSTVEDFISRGYTKGRSSGSKYYSPTNTLMNNETGKIDYLRKIGVGVQDKQTVTSLDEALKNQLTKYSDTYVDDIAGFNRQGFVNDLLNVFDEDAPNYEDVKTKLSSIQIPTIEQGQASKTSIVAKKEGMLASTFNGKNNKVLMGLAVVAGLGYMAYSPAPKQIEDENQDLPVYSNFYDEQYLGTGFVEFRERNKRYVY